MRTNTSRLTLALSGCLVAASTGFAALLGVMPGFPTVVFNSTGTTEFDVSSELFSVSATPLAIRFAPTDPPRLVQPVDGQRVLTLDFFISPSGVIAGGHPSEDLLVIGAVDVNGDSIVDFSGVLLTGEIAAYGSDNTGGTTDIFDFRFTVTGGLLDSYFMHRDIGLVLTIENSTFNGNFNEAFAGGAKGILGPIPMLAGFSGCTPGYWKQPHHFDSWPAQYTPTTRFEAVFMRDVPGDPTLVEALRLNGGGLNALMRHTTAGLLNAATAQVIPNPAVATTAQVIAAFQQAFDSGDYEPTKDLLEASNELGCPLN